MGVMTQPSVPVSPHLEPRSTVCIRCRAKGSLHIRITVDQNRRNGKLTLAAAMPPEGHDGQDCLVDTSTKAVLHDDLSN